MLRQERESKNLLVTNKGAFGCRIIKFGVTEVKWAHERMLDITGQRSMNKPQWDITTCLLEWLKLKTKTGHHKCWRENGATETLSMGM